MRGTPTAVVGAGKLARALAPMLGPAGYPVVAVAARRAGAARTVCRGLTGARATTRPASAAAGARLVLLAVSDRAIAPLASSLARQLGDASRYTVLHHAGCLGPEVLAPLRRAGASVGLLHPLQALGLPRLAPELLPGSRALVDGTPGGRREAGRLARALGLHPLRLPAPLDAAGRMRYHAAASLVSNDLVALVDLAIQLLGSIGLGPRTARDALVPLIRGVVLQVERAGPDAARTGPAARGDVETLQAHLDALGTIDPQAAELHRLLSLRLADSAGVGPGVRRRMRTLASSPAVDD